MHDGPNRKENEAEYGGLVSQHNSSICNEFKNKDRFREKLTECIKELEEAMNALEKPKYEIKPKAPKKKKNVKQKAQAITEG